MGTLLRLDSGGALGQQPLLPLPGLPGLPEFLGHQSSFDTAMWNSLLDSDHEGEDRQKECVGGDRALLNTAKPPPAAAAAAAASEAAWQGGAEDGLQPHSADSSGSPAANRLLLGQLDPRSPAAGPSGAGSGHAGSGASGSAQSGEAEHHNATGDEMASSDPCAASEGTRLRGSKVLISQVEFMAAIEAGEGKDSNELFDFRWPERKGKEKDNKDKDKAQRQSAILTLTTRQHGIMYALAGCHDVCFAMSKVTWPVRQAIKDWYDIDKLQFSTWFKNRRPPLKRRLAREGHVWVPARPRRSSTTHPHVSKAHRHPPPLPPPSPPRQQQRRHASPSSDQEQAVQPPAAALGAQLPFVLPARPSCSTATDQDNQLYASESLQDDLVKFEEPAAAFLQVAQQIPPQPQQLWWEQPGGVSGVGGGRDAAAGAMDVPRRPPRPSARLTERLAMMHHQRMLEQQLQQHRQQGQYPQDQDEDQTQQLHGQPHAYTLLQQRLGQRATLHCDNLERPELMTHIKFENPGHRHRISEPVCLAYPADANHPYVSCNSMGVLQRRSSLTQFHSEGGYRVLPSAAASGELSQPDSGPRSGQAAQAGTSPLQAFRGGSWSFGGPGLHDVEQDERQYSPAPLPLPSARLAQRLALMQQQQQKQQQQQQLWSAAEQQVEASLRQQEQSPGGSGSSGRLSSVRTHAADLGVRRPPLKYRHSEPTGMGLPTGVGLELSGFQSPHPHASGDQDMNAMHCPHHARVPLPGAPLPLPSRRGAMQPDPFMPQSHAEADADNHSTVGWDPMESEYGQAECGAGLMGLLPGEGVEGVVLDQQQQQHLEWQQAAAAAAQQVRHSVDMQQAQQMQWHVQQQQQVNLPHHLQHQHQHRLQEPQGRWSFNGGSNGGVALEAAFARASMWQEHPEAGGSNGSNPPVYRHSANGGAADWVGGNGGEGISPARRLLAHPSLPRSRSNLMHGTMPTVDEALAEPAMKPGLSGSGQGGRL